MGKPVGEVIGRGLYRWTATLAVDGEDDGQMVIHTSTDQAGRPSVHVDVGDGLTLDIPIDDARVLVDALSTAIRVLEPIEFEAWQGQCRRDLLARHPDHDEEQGEA